MYVIAGLGNPGKKYENTRHNMGFITVDQLAIKHDIKVDKLKFKALVGEGRIADQKVLLVKPQTYMNLSGESIRQVMHFYKLDPEKLIVIYDDIDLDPGNLRIRKKGSAGGHNGIKDIIAHLGTQEFLRIRVGAGAKAEGQDLVNHVLGHFSGEDRELVAWAIENAAGAVRLMVQGDTDAAMNQYNKKVVKE